MDDLINRANLPSVLNGVTMSECDKVIEPFLEERSCDEVWHAVRALRDFYNWVMSENTIEPCKDDLIKRSDAIKAYNEAMDELVKEEMEEWGLVDFTECSFNTTDCKLIARKIESVPAVEPSEYADIAYGIGVCQGKASVEPCEDAVSREWLLDELEQMNVANFYELNIHSNEMYKQMKRMLRDAPSVTVEPKHGKWKINNNGWAYCPECGSFGLESYSFCPYCGTKLTDKNIFVKGINVPNKTYEDGMAEAWKIAQTIFNSTVTLYEAMDVAKCMRGEEDETY